MTTEERLELLQISSRLIQWTNKLELNSEQKKTFIKIMLDFSELISWSQELTLDKGGWGP